MPEKLSWTTQPRRVGDLRLLDYNPRRITPERKEKLMASLYKFNLVEIPAINTDNTVIAGKQRVTVLLECDRADDLIDVRVPNRTLTEKELKEYVVISNTHAGVWDVALLEQHFGEVDFSGIELDLQELKDLAAAAEPPRILEAQEDDYEVPDEIVTDIVLGDLFEIGPHRLLCGDSTDGDDVGKVMGGAKIDLYITDPPYGVSYGEKNKFLNAVAFGNRIQEPIENDHMGVEDTGELWFSTFSATLPFMSGKASYYIFSVQGSELMMMMMIDKVFLLKHQLIWVKNNHVLGRSDYNYKHEPIFFGWTKKGTHEFFGGFQTSVFEFPKPQKNDLHPTMKPVALVARLIENSSQSGQVVFDSFLGSGTTIVAAHQLARRCYGLEISPKYCQVIVDRMHKLDPSLPITRNGIAWTPTHSK